jgi:hypothetical protein
MRSPIVFATVAVFASIAASIETQNIYTMHYDRSIIDAGEVQRAPPLQQVTERDAPCTSRRTRRYSGVCTACAPRCRLLRPAGLRERFVPATRRDVDRAALCAADRFSRSTALQEAAERCVEPELMLEKNNSLSVRCCGQALNQLRCDRCMHGLLYQRSCSGPAL